MQQNNKLRSFLEGTTHDWQSISGDKESYLSKLLVPSMPNITHSSLISLLKTLGPRQVCQYQFRSNDIVWMCKNCQKDETCVLCNECYLESDHEGHDVFWYLSTSGGCCDCGDADAWNPNGFCQKHGKTHHDPVSFISTEMRQNTEQMCQEIINQFLEFSAQFCDFESLCAEIDDDQPYTITLYHDDFHSLEEFQRMLYSEKLEEVLSARPENDSEQQLVKIGYLKLHSNISGDNARGAVAYLLSEKYKVRAISYAMRKRYDAILSALIFLQSLAVACDGMCKLICSSLSSELLSQMIDFDMLLDRDLARVFHDLLISLMADQSFKMVAAVAYANSFKKISKDYSEGYGNQGHTIFSLSVQFLNREVFVHEICYHWNYLDHCTGVLCSLIGAIRRDSNSFLKSPCITKRRYSTIVGDLKVIGTIPDISRLFLTKNLTEWMDILEFIQRFHPQKRLIDEHIQYEDLKWMPAFNLSLGLSSLFDYFCNWFSKQDAHQLVTKYSRSCITDNNITITHTSVIQVSSYVLDRCIQWQKVACNTDYDRTLKMLASSADLEMLVHFTRINADTSEQYSFHLPMHRFFSHILMEGFKHPHLVPTMKMIGDRLFSSLPSALVMQQVVLQPIHFAQQIKRNMWRRNGSGVYDEVINYSDPPYCRVFRDMDSLLLQFSMVDIPAKMSLWSLFSAFDILPCVVFPYQHIVPELRKTHLNIHSLTNYIEYATVMTTDALQLLINLVSELPSPPQEKVSDRLIPLLQRELVHVLAAGSVTYSKLQETMSVFHDTDKLTTEQIDQVVAQVANRIIPSNVNAPSLYVLKKENWEFYDPCFSRLNDEMHSKALELRPKFQESTPIAPIPSLCHPYFQNMRGNVLFDDFLVTAIRHLVYIAARNYTSKTIYQRICKDLILSNSDKFFPKIIQLITLSIYEAQREPCQSEGELNHKSRAYFGSFCADVPIDTVGDIDSPSLLEAMFDIYIANEVGTLGNDYHSLGWILDHLKRLSTPCLRLLERLERKSIAMHSRKADLDAMKTKSQQAAMQAIQAAASQFLANMDISDEDDDEEENEEAIQQPVVGIAERQSDDEEHGYLSLERNADRQRSNDEHSVDDIFGDDNFEDNLELRVLDEILGGRLPGDAGAGHHEKRGLRASKEDSKELENEEVSMEKQCIICMSGSSDSCLGLLGLCQPSNLTWSNVHRSDNCCDNGLYCPTSLPKVDHSKFMTLDLESCNLRIGFCGHYMHENCYLKYFYSSSRKSIYQDNMMLDPSLGFFSCPLCKRLCNCFLPVLMNPELLRSTYALSCIEEQRAEMDISRNSQTIFSSLKTNWGKWLQTYTNEDMDSTVRLIDHEEIYNYVDHERLIKFLLNTIGPLRTGSVMQPLDSNVNDKVKYLEQFISCITFTFCCDLLVGEVPGYFANNVQCMWSSLQLTSGEAFSSNETANIPNKLLPFRAYAPGKDDLRRISDIIPLIALFSIACGFDKLIVTSILQRVAGQCITSSPLSGLKNEREMYWLQNPESPLLALPLLDVVMFVTSISMIKYKFSRDEDDDHESKISEHSIPFEKLIPWLCLASLVQTMLIDDDNEEVATNHSDLPSVPLPVERLIPILSVINQAWQKSQLGVSERTLCPFDDVNLRAKMFKWVSFLRSVIHILFRIQADAPQEVIAHDWLFAKVEETSFNERLILDHMELLGLDWLLSLVEESEENAESRFFVEDIVGSWFSNMVFTASRSSLANQSSDGKKIPSIRMNYIDKHDEIKIAQVKFFPLYEKFRFYPTLRAPSLFELPKDYSKLHAQVHARCSYEFPAVCLRCGAILDANGQGQCLSHSYICSKGSGMYFTLQDCRIVLSHGPRCAYFASPYTNKYGEFKITQRGKPLQLDMNRVDSLQEMWLKHSIPNEVFAVRSTGPRVIIYGFY